MKKLIIFLVAVFFLSSCITVIFEPYWEDNQKEKKIDSHKERPASDAGKPLN